MIINELVLKNFGIYYKKNIFDFQINDDNNIILIGGENGAGKTTILEAIKLVLYGSLIMGLKTNTESYLNYIKEKINYNALKEDNRQDNMLITLNIDINRSGDIVNYQITRQWDIGSLNETLVVLENQKILNEEKTNLFTNYIRKIFSPALFDFFLFNGEKINNTIYEDNFHNNFREIASNIFNLAIPQTLKEDLQHIKNEHLNENSRPEAEKEYFKTLEELETAKKKFEGLESQINENEDKIKNYKNNLSSLKNRFSVYGGLFNQEIQKIHQEISKLEEKKSNHYSTLKNFYQSLLPFVITKNLLKDIHQQVEKENDYRSYQGVKNKLSQEIATTLEEEINPNYRILDKESNNDKKDEVLEKIISTINRSISPNFDLDSFQAIHHLSAIQEKNLINLIKDIREIDTDKMKEKLRDISNINNKLQSLNARLNNNEEDPEIRKTLEEIERLNNLIGKLESSKEQYINQKNELEIEINRLKKESKEKYKTLSNIIKNESVPLICNKLNHVLSSYIEIQSKKKIEIIENTFINIINNLISVENYINDIKIDPDTFKISLYDREGNVLNNLSSGEQELVILGLLWSLIEVSKQEFPIIFDTLLGRIDQKHRTNIINNMIKASQRQIIILSTDTEINKDFYNALKSNISNVFLLNKEDKINHKTKIEKRKYFYEGEIYGQVTN